jgi:hypothetical protein
MGLMRLRLHVLVLAGLVVGLLASTSGSASAAFTYSFGGSLERSGEPFSELGANSVAIDDANGKTYVADSGRGEVAVFETSSSTQLMSLDGSLTPAGSFGGSAVAVAANNATGDVYVLDATDGVVDVFDGTGGYVCQITGSSTPSASECNGTAGSDTPAHSFGGSRAIAVDQATGNVYVFDGGHEVIDIFSEGGAYLRQISLASLPAFRGSFTEGFAVDDFNGNVYVADSADFGIKNVYVLNAAGAYVGNLDATNTPARGFGESPISVAADDTSGQVYVTDSADRVTDIFAPSGEYLKQISPSSIEGRGTAIDQASNNVYISDVAASAVFIFDAVPIPDVTTDLASNVRPTSATLNGTVNPDGLPVTSCFFEYGTETSYGQSVPCAQAPGSGTSSVAVSADLSGLQEGATYHFRLVAENANGSNQGADEEVTVPAPPTITDATVENLDSNAVDLSAAINPHNVPSAYRFEYGTSTAYGTSVPVPDGEIAGGVTAQTVTQHVGGLRANTTYHWRVTSQNLAGSTAGSDHTFIYSTAGGGLPDNRAYEMVTPPQKNAAVIGKILLGASPDFSRDGSRVILPSIQCFAGGGSCTGNRQAEGEPFEFTRTAAGWVTTAMSPPATRFGENSAAKVSADVGSALFYIETPPAGEEDWWTRRSDGSFVDIGPAVPPADAAHSYEDFAGLDSTATADFSHFVWNSSPVWPFDFLTPQRQYSVYEYVGSGNAAPVLVGVSGGRGSTDLISTCGTEFGSLNSEIPGSLSADGRTVFFTAYKCPSGSGANAGVAVPANEVWARIDESRSVLLSGRSPAGCTSAECLGSPAGHAQFKGASADGSRAFFASTQQLTDSASEDSNSGDTAYGRGCADTVGVDGCNLYEYDFARGSQDNPVAVSAGDTSGHGPRVRGVMAVSSDGSHVYFVAKGVLSDLANSEGRSAKDGANNLYVFERDAAHPEGHTTFIATLPQADQEEWIGAPVANVTPDGRFLVFTSRGVLTADDTSVSGAAQVFRYDALSGVLARISIGDEGVNDNGNPVERTLCTTSECTANASIAPPNIFGAGAARLDPTMSDDGSYVFFLSPVALTPGALDRVQVETNVLGTPVYAQNVYEYHEGRVSLISDGRDSREYSGTSDVTLIGSDVTGRNVFFTTSDQLVAQDTDTQLDVYDARVCISSEPCVTAPTPAVACQGEGCRGAPPGAPFVPVASSVTFAGPGNLASPPVAAPTKAVVKKKHVKHKRHIRPAKRKKKGKRGRKASRAARNGRGGRS